MSSRQNRRQLYEKLVGQTVADQYDILSLMGFGGMGAVYEAVQRNMDRRVALKYIPSHDPVTAARFEREALTVSKLRHPNTVTVFDYGQTDDGFLFLSMELLSGRTLTDLIKQESPLEPARAVKIASQICRSLAEAHDMGIVHRDIKPDNVILIDVDGDPDVVKVLDFGIAKAVEREEEVTLTGDGRIIGTPRYMSPEQILSEDIDHRSDIYSLACIIFEMLCGAPPFSAPTTTALMMSHAQESPPPFAQRLDEDALAHIPDGLEDVVRRALGKAPAERPQSTEELRTQLEAALQAHQQGRAYDGPTAPAGSDSDNDASSKTPIVVGAAVGITLLVALAAFVALADADDADEPTDAEAMAADADTLAEEPDIQSDEDAIDDQPAPPQVSVRDTLQLRIDSEPQGADILEDAEALGQTPLNLTIESDQAPLALELQQEDYHSKEIVLEPDLNREDPQSFSFELERDRPARPAPRPSPPPTQEPEEPDDSGVPSIQLLGDDDDDDEPDDDDGPNIPTLN